MKLAYKLFFVLNTLFSIYILFNNYILYESTPDKIYLFIIISLLYMAITIYYFIKEVFPNKIDYIISSIHIVFIITSMILILMLQNQFTYANIVCYFDWILLIPCIIYTIYGLIKNNN